MNFRIDKFEGPLSLLLRLIEKQELDITEISLAKIADQYIKHIKNCKSILPEELADFLVVAAKLLLIKSMALSPFLKAEDEEEILEFENQLKMYKEFLEASEKIEAIIAKRRFGFVREFNRQAFLANANIFSPPKKLSAGDLFSLFAEIIKNIKPVEKIDEKIVERIMSIEEKILSIQKKLIDRIKTSFNSILANAQDKTEIIVSFLALLELMKQKNIVAVQIDMFGEIEINKI